MYLFILEQVRELHSHLTFLISKHWALGILHPGLTVGFGGIDLLHTPRHAHPMAKQTSPHIEPQDKEQSLVLVHLPQLSTNFPATSRKVFKGVNQLAAYLDLVEKQTWNFILADIFWSLH